MKSTIQLVTLSLLAVAIVVGCSKHDDKMPDAWNGEIRLNTAAQAHQTRTDAFNPDVQIATLQQVGLYITKADGTPLYANYAYTANGLGDLTLSNSVPPPYYPADGGNVKISAYHPHQSNSSMAYDFVVADDQREDAANYGSDLLFSAQREYRRQAVAHQLAFKHLLSKATYTLVQGTGSPALAGAKVEFLDLERAVSFNATTGMTTTATTSIKGNVTPHATHGAIVVPQTVAAGKNLIKVTLANGAELYHKAPAGGQKFAKGVKYHFTITVKYDEMKMTVQTAPWEPVGNVTGDAELGESEGLPLDQAQVGDFYCMDGFGESYILSKDATLTPEQQAACIGIVFWLGDPTNDTDGDPLLKKDFPGCTHGLVVALHEAKNPSTNTPDEMSWGCNTDRVNYWTNSPDRGENSVNITIESRYQGYANTTALKAYNKQQSYADLKVFPIVAIEQYQRDYPAPAGSSGWYVPSILELKYMCWGQGAISQNTAGRDLLNSQLDKVGGTKFDSSSWGYWSSSEEGGGSSLSRGVYFSDGYDGYGIKNYNELWVRAIFAF